MKAEVDAVREEVRVGERCWRFSLDCRRNTVAAALDGASFCVRPLRWGEKRNLARFARLGASFLEREFVKLSLDPDTELPRDDDQFAALLALARWINTPNYDGALPFDEILLTKVALGVAAAYRFMPDRLDGLYAFEVELLWAGEEQRAEDREASAPGIGLPAPGADTTRILVVPDPEYTAPISRADNSGQAASDALVRRGRIAAAPLRSGNFGDPPRDSPPRPAASLPAALPPPGPARVPLPTAMAHRAATAEPRPDPDASLAAAALVDNGSSPAVAARQAVPAAPPPRRGGFGRVAVTMHDTAQVPLGTVAAARVRLASAAAKVPRGCAAQESFIRALPPAGAPAVSPEHAAVVSPPEAANLARATQEASLEVPPATTGARSTDQPSADDLFRDWTEQLEQAAEELGIEIGN